MKFKYKVGDVINKEPIENELSGWYWWYILTGRFIVEGDPEPGYILAIVPNKEKFEIQIFPPRTLPVPSVNKSILRYEKGLLTGVQASGLFSPKFHKKKRPFTPGEYHEGILTVINESEIESVVQHLSNLPIFP